MARPLHLLLLLVPSSALAQTQPVFHWKLDESNGTTALAAVGTYNGTLAGGTTWAPTGGHFNGAARFDGVDDRIVLGACEPTSGGQELSLSLWVKPDFVTGMERTLVAKTTGTQASEHVWSLAFINGTAMRFRLRTGGTVTELATPPSSIFGGAWYHIVATYDGSEMRMYLNGGLMGSTSKTGMVDYAPQAPASIGALSTGANAFSGWVDDVRVYDQALTDGEVVDLLFESGTTAIHADAGVLPAPAIWQRMDIHDSTGHLVLTRTSTGSTFDLSSLSSGLYVVCLHGQGTRSTRRLVVP